MYNFGPLCIHFRMSSGGQCGQTVVGSLCCGCIRRKELLGALTATWGKMFLFDISWVNIPLSQTALTESREQARIEPALLVSF